MKGEKIRFSNHALLKFKVLEKHGIIIGEIDMRKIRYSKDEDILLIELSEKTIDYAEEEGQLIIHFSKEGEPVLIEILDAKEFIISSLSSLLKEEEVIIP